MTETMNDALNDTIATLKTVLRKKGKVLAEELDVNARGMKAQADVLLSYQEKYDNGHITLSELVESQEKLVNTLSDLLFDSGYRRAKEEYEELEKSIAKLEEFARTL